MSLPYFPLYPKDYEAKTSHLTMVEDGAYNRLLRLCWMTPGCSLPDDLEWIYRRARAVTDDERQAVRTVLGEFFTHDDGRVFQDRLRQEALLSEERHARRVEAGRKGGRPTGTLKTNDNAQSNAKARPKQPEPEPYIRERDKSLSVSREHFPRFWEAFPHRNGKKTARKNCEDKFTRAVKAGADASAIVAAAQAYREDPDVQRGYGRAAETWLNQRGWEDEQAPRFQVVSGDRYERTSKSAEKLRAFIAGAD